MAPCWVVGYQYQPTSLIPYSDHDPAQDPPLQHRGPGRDDQRPVLSPVTTFAQGNLFEGP